MQRGILDWLSAHAAHLHLHLHHNAHRSARTTIARHLLHRERIGEAIIYAGQEGRNACIEADTLWEISWRDLNGADVHVAGPTLEICAQVARAIILDRAPANVAA